MMGGFKGQPPPPLVVNIGTTLSPCPSSGQGRKKERDGKHRPGQVT